MGAGLGLGQTHPRPPKDKAGHDVHHAPWSRGPQRSLGSFPCPAPPFTSSAAKVPGVSGGRSFAFPSLEAGTPLPWSVDSARPAPYTEEVFEMPGLWVWGVGGGQPRAPHIGRGHRCQPESLTFDGVCAGSFLPDCLWLETWFLFGISGTGTPLPPSNATEKKNRPSLLSPHTQELEGQAGRCSPKGSTVLPWPLATNAFSRLCLLGHRATFSVLGEHRIMKRLQHRECMDRPWHSNSGSS